MQQIVNILNAVKNGVDVYEGLNTDEKNQLACLLDYYKEEKQAFIKEPPQEKEIEVQVVEAQVRF